MLLVLSLFFGGAGAARRAATATKVSVALNFQWQPAYAPLLYGVKRGYFKKQGINLDIQPTQGSAQAMDLINSGKVPFVFVDSDTYLTQRSMGTTPTTAVYVWLDRPTFDLVSLTPLSSLDDLSGKSFGTTAFSSGRLTLPYLLKLNGVDPGSVTTRILDFSTLYSSLFAGSIDTAEIRDPGSWQNLRLTAQKAGKKVYLTRLSDFGLTGYDKVLVVRTDLIKKNRALVQGMVTAVDQSLQQSLSYASDDDIYSLMKDVTPQSTRQGIVLDWHDFENIIATPGPIQSRIFAQSLQRLLSTGVIKSIPKVTTLYNNSFVAAARARKK